MNLQLIDAARLAGQQAPEILLSLPPQCQEAKAAQSLGDFCGSIFGPWFLGTQKFTDFQHSSIDQCCYTKQNAEFTSFIYHSISGRQQANEMVQQFNRWDPSVGRRGQHDSQKSSYDLHMRDLVCLPINKYNNKTEKAKHTHTHKPQSNLKHYVATTRNAAILPMLVIECKQT